MHIDDAMKLAETAPKAVRTLADEVIHLRRELAESKAEAARLRAVLEAVSEHFMGKTRD